MMQVQIPPLPLSGCVTLSELLNFSMSQISYFNNRKKNTTDLAEVAKRMLIQSNCLYVCGGCYYFYCYHSLVLESFFKCGPLKIF